MREKWSNVLRLMVGMNGCDCYESLHLPQRIVLTGGPGAGKTAVLEMARTYFCSHVDVLPESASILFGGGFPRESDSISRRAAQRAIFHVQNELEQRVLEQQRSALVLCDRGTVDGLAYWPGTWESYFEELNTSLEAQLSRYLAVIHLRTPMAAEGYNNKNPHRIETAEEALKLDARIEEVWKLHPRRIEVASHGSFLDKATIALEHIQSFVPPCCQTATKSSASFRL